MHLDAPRMFDHYRAAPNTVVLPGYMPVPGLGGLSVNAFVIRGAQPVLIDAGLPALHDEFIAELGKVLDPADLRWIWVTHTDPDHVGALRTVLELAPQAKIITTYLGMGKMNMYGPIAPDRMYLLNPGQRLVVGDRSLVAVKPPTFDAPETTALLDTSTGTFFSSDCFGAVTSAYREAAADIPAEELENGMMTWTSVDAPWLHDIAEERFASAVRAVRSIRPNTILSSHLPAAPGLCDLLLEHLQRAREVTPFVGPDQKALEAMLGAAA